ncbi:hypothetical protein MMYC01_206680 [Madurella mycetomatis]|uniref:Uncharacterized protein n=1 Tax=Madurella mycetomatis TaxID=100816 RepID=A0A175VYL5_9PEZI|nr:hypothetical protein MMYC01_206680 [Madurella mycetomatis]
MSQEQQDQWRDWRQTLKAVKGKSKRSKNGSTSTVIRNYEIVFAILIPGKAPDLNKMVHTTSPPSQGAANGSAPTASNQRRSRKHQPQKKRQASTSPAGERPGQRASHSTLNNQPPVEVAKNKKVADIVVCPGSPSQGPPHPLQAATSPLQYNIPDSQIERGLLNLYPNMDPSFLVPYRPGIPWQDMSAAAVSPFSATEAAASEASASTLLATTVPRSMVFSDARSRTSATSASIHNTYLGPSAPLPDPSWMEVENDLQGFGAQHDDATVQAGCGGGVDAVGSCNGTDFFPDLDVSD